MRNYKNFMWSGGITIGVSLIVLVYNFVDMYSLVEKCSGAHPCQAYDGWIALNEIGLVALFVGLIILAIGLWKRYRSK